MTMIASDGARSVEKPRHRQILQEIGPAVGKISGINHLVLFTKDMNEGVRFYRDLLGLRVVRTQRFVTTGKGLRASAHHSSGSAIHEEQQSSAVAVEIEVRQVFFEMGDGALFSLYEAPVIEERPDAPISSVLWPDSGKDRWKQPVLPEKLDHLAFNVLSHADVVWFREHLFSNGVAVSEVSERRGANNTHRFISSIYFSDPSGNPLEISSFDSSDAAWRSYDFSDWFIDKEPVAALVDDTPNDSPALVPHWVGSSLK